MKKILIWLVAIAAILFCAFKFMQYRTKQASPETTATYNQAGKDISVVYSSPSKKGRDIFGGLLPFGKVWRTGANEATTFTTNKDLSVAGQNLPAGKYTLWTIPEANEWTVIFNSKQYSWGVNFDGTDIHDASADILSVKVPVQTTDGVVDKFNIALADTAMTLAWDKTKVVVPIK